MVILKYNKIKSQYRQETSMYSDRCYSAEGITKPCCTNASFQVLVETRTLRYYTESLA